jgi:putative FmdB family regulatory protein
MPTYEYECTKCRKTFECFQSMRDNAFETCPKEQCRRKTWGKGKVRRLLGGGAGLIFKGSGFYITDYRSEGYKSAAKKESGAGGESGGSGGKTDAAAPAKTESKPESKPATETKTPPKTKGSKKD